MPMSSCVSSTTATSATGYVAAYAAATSSVPAKLIRVPSAGVLVMPPVIEEVAEDHRQESNDNTVNEVDRLKVIDEISTTRNACTNKEEYQSELAENL